MSLRGNARVHVHAHDRDHGHVHDHDCVYYAGVLRVLKLLLDHVLHRHFQLHL